MARKYLARKKTVSARKKSIDVADVALSKIDNHEKICRILQKQTQSAIDQLCKKMERMEIVQWSSAVALISGMFWLIMKLLP